MNSAVAVLEPDTHAPIKVGGANYIVSFDPMQESHVKGFGDLMNEQGAAHGRRITDERKEFVSEQAGKQYQCTLLCRSGIDGADSVLSMATTKQATLAEGKVTYLEDIVTTGAERGKQYAALLMKSLLIRSWEAGHNGFAWETGRNNDSARGLYAKFDQDFNTINLPNVWRLSRDQLAKFSADDQPKARLAVPKDNVAISAQTLVDRQDPDSTYFSRILERQKTNGHKAEDFIVVARDNSIAIVSEAYSTFQAKTRGDARIYLSSNATPEGVRELVRGVGQQIMARPLRGSSAQIELVTSDIARAEMPPSYASQERRRLAMAETALANLGAEKLEHGKDDMVAYSLIGKRYVAAVIDAVNILPQQQLSQAARNRLTEVAYNYNLVA